ncbi:GNAT family N-acetyltransferase [Flavitalea flava]
MSMSIKPYNRSRIRKNVDKTRSHPELCMSFLLAETQYPLPNTYLPEKKITVSARPLSLEGDIPVIYNWLKNEVGGPLKAGKNPPAEFLETYALMQESSCAQSFIGEINTLPVCLLEVFKVREDMISLYYEARPGDYGLRLTMAPLVVQDHAFALIEVFVSYFLSFPEVNRIVAEVDPDKDWINSLFPKAGFRFSHQIDLSYKTANLYMLSR